MHVGFAAAPGRNLRGPARHELIRTCPNPSTLSPRTEALQRNRLRRHPPVVVSEDATDRPCLIENSPTAEMKVAMIE